MNHTNEEIRPTATQRRAAIKQARDDARAAVETALGSLDDARTHLAFLGADMWLSDCQTAIAMTEDLRDSMEVDDG